MWEIPDAQFLFCCSPPLQDNGLLHDAEVYCTRLLDFGGPQSKERAKGLLREVLGLQQAQRGAGPAFGTPMMLAPQSTGGGDDGSDLDMSPG